MVSQNCTPDENVVWVELDLSLDAWKRSRGTFRSEAAEAAEIVAGAIDSYFLDRMSVLMARALRESGQC